jgi:hypothetical protein
LRARQREERKDKLRRSRGLKSPVAPVKPGNRSHGHRRPLDDSRKKGGWAGIINTTEVTKIGSLYPMLADYHLVPNSIIHNPEKVSEFRTCTIFYTFT